MTRGNESTDERNGATVERGQSAWVVMRVWGGPTHGHNKDMRLPREHAAQRQPRPLVGAVALEHAPEEVGLADALAVLEEVDLLHGGDAEAEALGVTGLEALLRHWVQDRLSAGCRQAVDRRDTDRRSAALAGAAVAEQRRGAHLLAHQLFAERVEHLQLFRAAEREHRCRRDGQRLGGRLCPRARPRPLERPPRLLVLQERAHQLRPCVRRQMFRHFSDGPPCVGEALQQLRELLGAEPRPQLREVAHLLQVHRHVGAERVVRQEPARAHSCSGFGQHGRQGRQRTRMPSRADPPTWRLHVVLRARPHRRRAPAALLAAQSPHLRHVEPVLLGGQLPERGRVARLAALLERVSPPVEEGDGRQRRARLRADRLPLPHVAADPEKLGSEPRQRAPLEEDGRDFDAAIPSREKRDRRGHLRRDHPLDEVRQDRSLLLALLVVGGTNAGHLQTSSERGCERFALATQSVSAGEPTTARHRFNTRDIVSQLHPTASAECRRADTVLTPRARASMGTRPCMPHGVPTNLAI